MAGPLSIFRKYQYILLVVFGVMLMVAFVIAPPILDYQRTRQSGEDENAVVVSWKGGSLRESDIDSLRLSRNLVRVFLDAVVQKTYAQNGFPRVPRILAAGSEEDVVRTVLLAEEAKRMGLTVSDKAVIEYLEQLSAELIPSGEIGSIFQQTLGDRMGERQMFGVVRTELLAQNFMMMMHPGIFLARGGTMPPFTAWQYHKRLHRRVSAELIPLEVAGFKADLTVEPTEAQINSLYEEAKDRFPDPDFPEPGFKRRRKIAFQYVRADLDELVEQHIESEKKSVTDADLEDHYESNKERYRVLELPSDVNDGEDTDPETDDGAEGGEMTEKESPPSKDDAPPPSGDEAAPGGQSTTDGDPDTEPQSDGQSGAMVVEGDEYFVSRLQDEPPQGEPTDDPSGEVPAASEDATPAGAEESSESSDAAPTDADEDASDEKEADTDNTEPASSTPDTEEESPAEEEPKYKPLDDELREEIREEIARSRAEKAAQDQMEDDFAQVRRTVDEQARLLRRSESPPPALDNDSLANERLTAGETPLVDSLAVQEYPLGRAFEQVEFSWPPQREYFHQIAYRDEIRLYRPAQIRGETGSVFFVYWKVNSEESFVPSLEDIREEVIDAWKQQQALPLAKQEAERLQEQASKAGKPLSEVFGEDSNLSVSETSEFSWMSTGFTPAGMGAPGLSSVQGVEGAGEQFMQAVFALGSGDVGIAVNQPKTFVYLVRIASESPSEDILREQFLQSGRSAEIRQIAATEEQKLVRDWYEDLESQRNLEWHREPLLQ